MLARTHKTQLPPGAAILTFDDGFRNFYSVVAPILIEKQLPGTCFIITSANFTKEASEFDKKWVLADDDSFLAWDEIRQLSQLGIEFGSHTSTHVPLSCVSLGEARIELKESLDSLVRNIGGSGFALAYPHGDTSESVNQLAESVGYSCALTTILGHNDDECDMFALRRTVIAGDDDVPSLAARVSGLTWRWDQLRSLVKTPVSDVAPANAPSYDASVANSE